MTASHYSWTITSRGAVSLLRMPFRRLRRPYAESKRNRRAHSYLVVVVASGAISTLPSVQDLMVYTLSRVFLQSAAMNAWPI